MENYDGTPGAVAEFIRKLGVRASVAAPMIVDGRLWAVTFANWTGEKASGGDPAEPYVGGG